MLAVFAAGCNAGTIGDGNESPGTFSPAASPIDSGSADTSAAADTNRPIDESSPEPEPEPVDPGPDPEPVDSGSAIADTGSAAPDTTIVDTGSSAPKPDTSVVVVDTGSAVDTSVVDTGSAADTSVADTAPTLAWRKANLTWYTSYPDPGSEECIKYSGCEWAGQFAALPTKMSESWVRANNIAAVHGKDFEKYKLKTLRLRQGTKQIDVKVYDMCADSDCSGCCTKNSSSTGFLIDIEKYTAERFGTNSGVVEWTCLDC